MGYTHVQPRIINRTARIKLAIRRDPYWHLIAAGQHLGYRKIGESRGSWIARCYTRQRGRRFLSLGIADDILPPNGTHVLSFQQAAEAAQAWFARVARADANGVKVGPYKVSDAAADWLTTWGGSERSRQTSQGNVDNHILPLLGDIELAKLTRQTIEQWLHQIATKPPIKSLSSRSKTKFRLADPEAKRRRQDTANRIFNDLRALLNRAYENQLAASKMPWETVKRFDNVDVAKNEYFTLEESKRFIKECDPDFRALVQAALITGCRYGELSTMKVSAFDVQLGAISLVQGKTGKMKRVFLTHAEASFFKDLASGKGAADLLFKRDDSRPWGKSHQQPRMRAALLRAKINRHVRFHDLRHTFATLLVMNGTSVQLVANQLGHSGTRIAEKTYAHFSPAYISSTIRANKPDYGIAGDPTTGETSSVQIDRL